MKTLIQITQHAHSPWHKVILTTWLAAVALPAFPFETNNAPRHPLMFLTPEQGQRMMADHLKATLLSSNGSGAQVIDFPPSFSLLSLLPYVPAQRDQGSCGNCWAWAGTGVMEIAHAVNNRVQDRLSVQFLNSCNPYISCCEAGWLANVAQFYAWQGFAIPWANNNAQFLSGSGSCSSAPCGSLATTPRYSIDVISEVGIATWGVGQAQAIVNIKSALLQSNALWFGFFMSNETDWDNFFNFWDDQPESSQWTSLYPGQAPAGGGGHAVLCVGYDDTDPAGPCWIMVNSWGTTAGRPNGLFRVSQNLNYDSADSTGSPSLYWQTLNVQFAPPTQACVQAPIGLIDWWRCEGNGIDWVGINNGVLSSGVTSTPGMVGLALHFDSTTNSAVQITNPPNPQTLSVEAWVQFDTLDSAVTSWPGLQYLVFRKNTRLYNFEGFTLLKSRGATGDRLGFEMTSADPYNTVVLSTNTVTTNAWYHLVGTFDGATMNLYVDGVLHASGSHPYPVDYGTSPMFFGTSGETWDGRLAGTLDELSLYDRALTAQEVAVLYASGSGGKCPQTSWAPGFQSVARGTGTIGFTWVSTLGRAYQLQYTTSLTQANWLNLGAAITATDSTTSASDLIGPDRQRFYRVMVMP